MLFRSKADDYPESSKKKNRKRKGGDFVAAADRAPQRRPQQGNATFEEMMGQTCYFHGPKSNHLTRDCNLLKKMLANNSSAPRQNKKDKTPAENSEFPKENAVLMILVARMATSQNAGRSSRPERSMLSSLPYRSTSGGPSRRSLSIAPIIRITSPILEGSPWWWTRSSATSALLRS